MFLLQSETRGELTSLIDEMVGNQKVVRAFGYEDEAVSRFGEEINQRLEKHSLRAIFFSSITNPSTPLCEQPGVRGRGCIRGAFCHPGRTDGGPALHFPKLCQSVYQAL